MLSDTLFDLAQKLREDLTHYTQAPFVGVYDQPLLDRRERRALKKQGLALHRTRGGRQQIELGDYYVTDGNNILIEHHCDLEILGRGVGLA